MSQPNIPLSVPFHQRQKYANNYRLATRGTDKLFLFAGDQKIEHMHDDFYGLGIPQECGSPEHLFKIAEAGRIGVFATQLGLISRYAGDYKKTIPYVVKLNAKTNLIQTAQQDPKSILLTTVAQVVEFAKYSELSIVGVGYTLYLGSECEAVALQEAAQVIYQAQQAGLLTVLWIYPRGKAVKNEKDFKLIAGAAGVGTALGADFIKINPPEPCDGKSSAELLSVAAQAAGNSSLICSGGVRKDENAFLQELYEQITVGQTKGCATGRNIHQKTLPQALAFCSAIAALLYDHATVDEACKLLK